MHDFWKQPINGYPRPFDPWTNTAGCTFDEATAERVVAYWEKTYTLKDGQWEGRPFKLLDWQKQIVGHLFGWKRPDKSRRFRALLLYVPKKNGKTEFGAGLGLTLLHADGENGAEVYSCASDTTQAKLVFDAAAKMIGHRKKLSNGITIYKGYKAFEYAARKSYWKVLSSRAESKHGPNVHGLLIDELHTQRDNELVSTLEAGTIARRQPLSIKMTTAGHTGDTPCNRELEYARGVRDGDVEDPYYMPVIFDGQDAYKQNENIWKEPKFWRKVNPSFGITVQADYFKREVNKCQITPSHSEVVKRLHLNIQTDDVDQWLDYERWKALSGTIVPEGPCYGGLDLSSTTDVNALSLFWPETNSLTAWFWIPQQTAESRAEWQIWKKHERVHIADGVTTDYRWIRKTLNDIAGRYDLKAVAYDPWNAPHIVTELSDEDDIQMVEFRQGYASMNQASKEFERRILSGELLHDDNPVLNWMIKNCKIKTDPHGNIKPVKPERNSTKKVDGVITSVMAAALANTSQENKQPDTPAIVAL